MKATRYSIAACTLAAAYAAIKRNERPHAFNRAIALPSIDIHTTNRHLVHNKQNDTPYSQRHYLLPYQPTETVQIKTHQCASRAIEQRTERQSLRNAAKRLWEDL